MFVSRIFVGDWMICVSSHVRFEARLFNTSLIPLIQTFSSSHDTETPCETLNKRGESQLKQAVLFAGCERSIFDILVYPKTNYQTIERAFIVGLSYMFFPKAGRLWTYTVWRY